MDVHSLPKFTSRVGNIGQTFIFFFFKKPGNPFKYIFKTRNIFIFILSRSKPCALGFFHFHLCTLNLAFQQEDCKEILSWSCWLNPFLNSLMRLGPASSWIHLFLHQSAPSAQHLQVIYKQSLNGVSTDQNNSNFALDTSFSIFHFLKFFSVYYSILLFLRD